MKLSVIVPIYNVSTFLSRCVESLINQNNFQISESNIEIILVNDGSTDNSQQVIEYYVSKYSFIKGFEKQNGGLSDARNYGLKKSSGDYVWFIDSDDWISEDSFEIVFKEISLNHLDVMEFDFYSAKENINTGKITLRLNNFYNSIQTNVITGVEALELYGYIVGVCYKVIRKDILIKNNLSFPLGELNEDHIISYQLMRNCHKYKKLNIPLYYYYSRSNSITNNIKNEHSIKYITDQFNNIISINNIVKNENFSRDVVNEILYFYTTNIIFQLIKLKNRYYLFDFLRRLENENLYPIQKYKYHNSNLKRKLFIRLINRKELLKIFIKK